MFYSQMFNSSNDSSISFYCVVLMIFLGICSLIKRRMPQPWEFLSCLNGEAFPSILNCAFGEEESSFVFETIRMSMLSYTALGNIANFPIMDLMFICPMRNLFTLFIQMFFRISSRSSLQLLLVVLKVSIDSIGFNQNHPLASLCCFTISLLQQCNSLQALTFHVYLNVDSYLLNVFQWY